MRSVRPAAFCIVLSLLWLPSCATRQAGEASREADEGAPPVAVADSLTTGSEPLCEIPAVPPSPSATLAEFAEFSWRVFVALSWPAKTGARGVPDCAAAFGTGPTVWETYKTTEQVFLPGAADPDPWDAGEMGQPTLFYRSKVPQNLPVENAIRQAVGGWLIDQNGNPTYYQIGIDRTSYQYIRENDYYNAQVVSGATSIDFPDGSMEIKAAWRILESGDDAGRFYSREARVAIFDAEGNPTGETKAARVGLVGFHATYKAKGFPQWIWTTFEHEDNAPTKGGSTSGVWSYFDPSCTDPQCDPPNQSPLATGQPFGSPNQIVRITPLESVIAASNSNWTGMAEIASTPFANYELISPQWPTAPNDPGQPQGAPTPSTVANITLESYIQPTSSCMDCHSTARVPGNAVKSNYSFVFLFAQTPEGDES